MTETKEQKECRDLWEQAEESKANEAKLNGQEYEKRPFPFDKSEGEKYLDKAFAQKRRREEAKGVKWAAPATDPLSITHNQN